MHWPWRPPPPPPAPPPSLSETLLASAPPLPICAALLAIFLLLRAVRTANRFQWRAPVSLEGLRLLLRTIFRLLMHKGSRRPGELTGLVFPIQASDLAGPNGAAALEALLRHGGHLPLHAGVATVRVGGSRITDGVKGDKHVLHIEYSGAASGLPPAKLFAKFSLGGRCRPPQPLLLLADDATLRSWGLGAGIFTGSLL